MSAAQMIAVGVVTALASFVVAGAFLTRIVFVGLADRARDAQGPASSGSVYRPTTVRGASRLFSAVWSGKVLADADARTASAIRMLRILHVLYFALFFAVLAAFLLGAVPWG